MTPHEWLVTFDQANDNRLALCSRGDDLGQSQAAARSPAGAPKLLGNIGLQENIGARRMSTDECGPIVVAPIGVVDRMNQTHNLTQVLKKVEAGDPSAAVALLPLVYDELRRVAAEKLAQERPGQTLQATALVHEAWLRLVDVDYEQSWSSRRHFFGAAAEAMRRILVDKARRKGRQKHGVDWQRISIEVEEVIESADDPLLESLDMALQRFEQVDATACELVKLRYFAGLSQKQAGQVLDLAPRTTDRLWAYAKAWLLREVRRETDDGL